jgi:hypothetical protein
MVQIPEVQLPESREGVDAGSKLELEPVEKQEFELPGILEAEGFLTPDSGIGADSGVGSVVSPERLDRMQPYPGVEFVTGD